MFNHLLSYFFQRTNYYTIKQSRKNTKMLVFVDFGNKITTNHRNNKTFQRGFSFSLK